MRRKDLEYLEALEHIGIRQRKNGKWSYRFEKAKVNGRRQSAEKGGYDSKAEAMAAGIKAYEAYENGQEEFRKSTMSLADYLDIWYERTRLRCRNNTNELREKNIRLHIKPALGSYRLSALTPALIDDFITSKRKAGYAYETVGRILNNLSTALDYAIYPMQLLKDNPARYIKVPGAEMAPLTTTPPRRRIENDELDMIFKRYPFGDAYHMPYALGLYFGSRIGETLAMSWDNCDTDNLTMVLSVQIQRLSLKDHVSFHYLCDVKTELSNRSLIFDRDIMLPLLQRWKQQQRKNELHYGEDYFYNYLIPAKDFQGRDIKKIVSLEKHYPAPGPRIDIICTQANGKYIKPASLEYTCGVIRRMGIHGFNFHCLRHTNLTMLGEGHLVSRDIMARAGHADYRTSLDYIDDRPDMQETAVKVISGKLRNII